ncbi:MAG: hypothetical protein MJZ64_08260 [Paludibacteraceae bacterium]|nr:hypothetical protein [Paludibacteraceae bacterium]
MKKYVFMLATMVVALSLTSCKGEKGDPGMNVEWSVFDVTVQAEDWEFTESPQGNYFRYLCTEVPEMTEWVWLNGLINAYIYLPDPKNFGYYQRQLPFIRHKALYEDGGYTYTEAYDYEFGRGWVEFQYRASDFAYDTTTEFDPPAQEFRIVIQW